MWGIASVLQGIPSGLHVEVVQYSGDSISTVEDSFSTVEGIQYNGGNNISTCGGLHRYSGGQHQYCGGYSVQWGKNFNFGMFGH